MKRYRFQSFELVPAQRLLTRDGIPVHAEPKVFDFILFLLENRARVVSREQAIEALWDGTAISDAALSRLIKESRRLLGDSGESQTYIRTFRARGVRFVADVKEGPDLAAERRSRSEPDESPASDATGDASSTCQHDDLVVVWVHPRRLATSIAPGGDPTVLGRDQSCHVVLPGSDTSRRHAELSHDGTIALIRDLGSRNGSYVNGQRVERAPLAPGDVTRCGDWVGVVMGDPLALRRLPAAPPLAGRDADIPLSGEMASREPLLVVGESGVGKTHAVHHLHECSGRPHVVRVTCSGQAPGFSIYSRLESLPGPATLVLEEVGELPEQAQGELVRLLNEEGAARVRVLATSEVPLLELRDSRGFRADLAGLLLPNALVLPPLRARPGEVPAWLSRFSSEASGGSELEFSAGSIELAMLHDWPFNLHEVRFVARALVARHGMRGRVRTIHMQELLRSEVVRENDASVVPLEHWRTALRNHRGRLHAAARALKLSPSDGIRLLRGSSRDP